MKDAIKALCAVPFLVGALLLLRLAYWICPGLQEQPKVGSEGAWWDGAEGWERRTH